MKEIAVTGEELLKGYNKSLADKSRYKSSRKEAWELVYGTGDVVDYGKRVSMVRDAVLGYSTSLQRIVVPKGMRWFDIKQDADEDADFVKTSKGKTVPVIETDNLGIIANIVTDACDSGGFQLAISRAFQEVAFGYGCIHVGYSDGELSFTNVSDEVLSFSEDSTGSIDKIYITHNINDKTKATLRKRLAVDDMFTGTVVEIVVIEEDVTVSFVRLDTSAITYTETVQSSPYIIFRTQRAMVDAVEKAYGIGVVQTSIPDIKKLFRLEHLYSLGMSSLAKPMYMKDASVKIGDTAFREDDELRVLNIKGDDLKNTGMPLVPLPTAINIEPIFMEKQLTEKLLQDRFLVNGFSNTSFSSTSPNSVKSATEVVEIAKAFEEKLYSSMMVLEDELIKPLIKRVLNVLQVAGILVEHVEELKDLAVLDSFKIHHRSTLRTQYDTLELQKTIQQYELVSGVIPPEVLDNYIDIPKLIKRIEELVNPDRTILRSDREIKEYEATKQGMVKNEQYLGNKEQMVRDNTLEESIDNGQ